MEPHVPLPPLSEEAKIAIGAIPDTRMMTYAGMAARIFLLEGAMRRVKIEADHALKSRVGNSAQDVELTRESLNSIVTTAALALDGARG